MGDLWNVPVRIHRARGRFASTATKSSHVEAQQQRCSVQDPVAGRVIVRLRVWECVRAIKTVPLVPRAFTADACGLGRWVAFTGSFEGDGTSLIFRFFE